MQSHGEGSTRPRGRGGEAAAGALDSLPAAEHAAIASEPPGCVTQGRYRIEAELGRGGMGAVQRVVDRVTGQTLALKRLLLDPEKPQQHARVVSAFEQEFHILSQLRHPRIIEVFDYGRDAIGPYYTMEVVEGQDLRALSPMPYRKACEAARDVVSSLAVLHSRGFVHRDVTPHNIRCDSAGRAKLLDFGAMCPMGLAKDVVGTPPFVPPEALQHNMLDGRADLFALGASLYCCLSGRHAYPARTLGQLVDIWRSAPRPLAQLNDEVPARLSDLVMELLSLKPLARPPNAAVVFERLIAIAGLPRVEALEVRSAYLTSPTLVGRDDVLSRCRGWLLKSLRGRGRSVLAGGAAGLGRSRLLDALCLEAKLLGACVLRADASDAANELGVLRRLLLSLLQARPELVLAQKELEQLRDGEPITGAQRKQVLAAFNRWILEQARSRRFVIAVDDVHAIDEPSLAGLAALASELSGTRILLATTMNEQFEARSPAAIELLSKSSRRISLSPLSQEHVRQMLASVFNEADNLDVLASVLYRHAKGNPGLTMESAQALVDANVVRYAAGSWHLPTAAIELQAALPRDASLSARLAALSDDAWGLAALLSLDTHGRLQLADWARISAHGDASRVFDALDELVEARVLVRRAEGCGFARADYAREVARALPGPLRLQAHRRLSLWYGQSGHTAACAHQAAQAGDWVTVEKLTLALCDDELHAVWQRDPTAIPTFEAMIERRLRQDPPAPSLLRLRCQLLQLCVMQEEWVRVVRHGPQTLEDLMVRCGLTDCGRLSDLPSEQRSGAATARAEERDAQILERVPDNREGLTTREALRQLPSVVLGVAVAARLAMDPEMAETVPSLAPLYPLSPAYPLVDRLRAAIVANCQGRIATALHKFRAVHAELTSGHHELDSVHRDLTHFALGFLQGIEGTMANPKVLERIEHFKGRSPKRVERERYAYYNAIGDVELAEVSRRQLERLEVQEGTLRYFPTAWHTEYSLHALTNNVEGLRRCEQQALRVSKDLPGWRPLVELARIARAQCGACSEETLARSARLLRELRAGSSERRYALYLHSRCLIDLGRYEQCRVLMQSEIDALGRDPQWHEGYYLTLALAEAHLGLHQQARQHVDRHVTMYLGAGVQGVLRGLMHEKTARIALLAGDTERFREHAELCATQYRSGYNPALTARYESLMREAINRRVAVSDGLKQAARFSERTSASQLRSIFRTQLSTCIDAPSRFHQALSLVVQRTQALGGVLYLARPQGLSRAAAVGQLSLQAQIDDNATAFWKAETQADTTQTVTMHIDELAVSHSTQRSVGFFLLSDCDPKAERACGVLALQTAAEPAAEPDHDAMVALAQLMLEEEGVVGRSLD